MSYSASDSSLVKCGRGRGALEVTLINTSSEQNGIVRLFLNASILNQLFWLVYEVQ